MGAADIWVADLQRGTESRLTFDLRLDDVNAGPIWSHDGEYIVFRARDKIYRKASNGAGEHEALLTGHDAFVLDWSRDGRFLLLGILNPKTLNDLAVLEEAGDGNRSLSW